jgi:type IV pilus assembly protein PilB
MQRSDPAAQPPPAAPAAPTAAGAVNLATVRADPLALSLIPRVVADRYRLVPLERQGDVLTVAMTDPGDVYLIDELARLAGCRVVPVAANPSDIQSAISRLYTQLGPDDFAPAAAEQQAPASSGSTRRVPESVVVLGQVTPNADAPAVILLNQILGEAIDQRASDIHIEPFENDLYMRFRIDGILTDWLTVDPDQHAPLISRIKVLSNMDIAEHRLPLDGRFTIQHKNQQRWDIRVSTVPGVFGEKAVLRLLPKDTSGIALEGLGMQERELRLFESLIAKPYGMILVTGPTGAGKTTTLYAVLRRLDCVGKNVLTIEDPVEYELPRVTQMQVHSRIGLSFATGLRHFLRQDPDIMMVGEIRDAETLEMAVQAALTGHLVLSTLHCNDAAAAAPRALDMGLEPFLLTSSVIGVMAQRLVRKVCQNCRTLEPLPPSVRQRFGVTDPRAGYYRGRGCANCRQTGYRGRLGVFEVMVMNDPVKEAVQDRASAGEIRKIAVQHGMVTLQGDAIRKVQMGLTTPEEVLRAVWMEGD